MKEIVPENQMTMVVGYCFFYSGVGALLGPIVTGAQMILVEMDQDHHT